MKVSKEKNDEKYFLIITRKKVIPQRGYRSLHRQWGENYSQFFPSFFFWVFRQQKKEDGERCNWAPLRLNRKMRGAKKKAFFPRGV
jgi:hypothetical protein